MTSCDDCNQEMTLARSCSAAAIQMGGLAYARRRFRWRHVERCDGCGIARGGVHHLGCDVERCPRCGGQLITCGCLDAAQEEVA